MRLEHVDRRVIGATRVVDATTRLPIGGPLSVEATGVRLIRGRGHFVIAGAPELEDYAASFEQPPATPAIGSLTVELTVRDPSRRYLARRQTIRLPRDPDPGHADQPDSLFRAVDVPLFPSPTAQVASGWAIVRATVTQAGGARQLGGALIRVERTSDGAHLASGLADERGEALVAVAGIPVTTWGGGTGSVLVSETDATLIVVFDPAADPIPDPDDLEARQATLPSSSVAVRLASGRTRSLNLSVPLP